MKFACAILAAFCLTSQIGRAQSADEQYIRIYQTIQEADRLNDSRQGQAAAAKYIEAQEALRRFQNVYPGWNDRVISYRLSYVAGKLAPFTTMLAASATNAVAMTSAAPALVSVPAAGVATPGLSGTPVIVPGFDVSQQLAVSQQEIARLQADNRLLAAKLKESLSVQPAASDPRELAKAEDRARTLEKENELLKVRLRSSANAPGASAADNQQSRVAEQNEIIAVLRAENDVLKARNAEYQKKIEQQSLLPAANPDSAMTRAMQEKDGTIRKLNEDVLAMQKELALLKERERQIITTAKAGDTDGSLVDNLRARLQVLEAKPVPYTKEELALIEKSGVTLAYANPAAPGTLTQPPPAEGSARPRRVSKEVPPGAGTLVREAERAFALRNYAEAEKKYLDVLRQDQDNVSTLANLASTQLELGNLTEAAKNAQRALALDPNDHFALYVMGRIKFREDKLDEALDALSRSAKANPEYAETQNYLGIVLSEKGLRIPAETALRKAVQLQPGHAAAHNNLAVVYATQTPPALALARWHYQRALAAGHPKNAELEKLLEQK